MDCLFRRVTWFLSTGHVFKFLSLSMSALEVQHDYQMPFDFVPPNAKAKPLRKSQAHDTSTADAGTSNVPFLSSAREQPVGTVHAGGQAQVRNADRTGHEPFTKAAALVLPMSRLAQPRPDGPVPLADSRSDLMHSQYRLSVLQWNPGPARKNVTQIIPAACGRFHAGGPRATHLGELLHLHGR